jgi:hypothetical protein
MMSEFIPIRFKVKDGALHPVGDRGRELFHTQLKEGQIITMEPLLERNMAQHRAYFASLKDIWDSRPEYLDNAPHLASTEHMRHWALICTGWCDTDMTVFDNEDAAEAALKAVRFARRMTGTYTMSFLREAHHPDTGEVTSWTLVQAAPKSQSVKKMGKEDFRQSMDDVLEYCSRMVLGENQATG